VDSHTATHLLIDWTIEDSETPSTSSQIEDLDLDDFDWLREAEAERHTPHSSPVQNSDDSSMGMDWDSNWATRLWQRILDEKRQLRDDRQELETIAQEVQVEKQNLIQFRQTLETREAKIIEAEPLIPSVKNLQNIGITLELMFAIMQAIEDKAIA
jgi:hypothetical protein